MKAGEKKDRPGKGENGRDDDEAEYRFVRNEGGGGTAPGRARRGRNRAGTKKIRRKAGLIRALVALPPPELIDCMESAGERKLPAFLLSHRALAHFLRTDKLASARLPRVINRRIAFVRE